MKKIDKKACRDFITRYKAGATVTAFTNRFNIKDGWLLLIKGHYLYVYYDDGDFFDKYDIFTEDIYIND